MSDFRARNVSVDYLGDLPGKGGHSASVAYLDSEHEISWWKPGGTNMGLSS